MLFIVIERIITIDFIVIFFLVCSFFVFIIVIFSISTRSKLLGSFLSFDVGSLSSTSFGNKFTTSRMNF
jgi:4-amino-4-deoxy-L-arabinose transferase-like glycosyltransferase